MTRQTQFVSYAAEQLRDYIFANVWNAPEYLYHTNLAASLVSTTKLLSYWDIKSTHIALPRSSVEYYGYVLYGEVFDTLDIGSDTWTDWTSVAGLMVNKNIDIRIYGANGEMLYRPLVYFRKLDSSCDVLMVIQASMLKTILGSTGDASTIYVSVANRTTPMDYRSCRIQSRGDTTLMAGAIDMTLSATMAELIYSSMDMLSRSTNPGACTAFVNGKYVDAVTVDMFQDMDYVEFIQDLSISYTVKLRLPVPNTDIVYSSPTLSGMNRTVLHMPKSSNPSNALITYTMCDMYVRSYKTGASARDGYYIHPCYGDTAIAQLTHQDFAIQTSILDNYSTKLTAGQYLELTFKVRKNPSVLGRTLIREANYLNLLYTLSDSQIVAFLAGHGDITIPEWKAEALEYSVYGNRIFNTTLHDQTFTLDTAIDVLGYHTVEAQLHPRVFEYRVTTINANGTISVAIPTPYAFLSTNALVLIYVNGIKCQPNVRINNTECTVSHTTAHNVSGTMYVVIPSGTGAKVGDLLTLELFEYAGQSGTQQAVATGEISDSNNVFTIPYKTFVVYQKNAEANTVKMVTQPTAYPFSQSYVLTDDYEAIENSDGTITITMDLATYGLEYFIIDTSSTTNMTSYPFYLQDAVYTGTDVAYTLASKDGPCRLAILTMDHHHVTPDSSYRAFLNGRSLVEGIDFTVRAIYDPAYVSNDHFVGHEIVLTSTTYLTTGRNRVDVYNTNDKLVTKFKGFVVDAYMARGVELPVWYPKTTSVFVQGLLKSEALNDDYDVSTGLLYFKAIPDQGCFYNVETTLSASLAYYLNGYASDADEERLQRIYTYLKTLWNDSFDYVIVRTPYKVYSVYVSRILSDIASERITVVNTEDYATQLADYLWLKDFDPVFGDDLDLKFVDLYPTWHRYAVPRTMYLTLMEVAAALLPNDPIHNGDVANV